MSFSRKRTSVVVIIMITILLTGLINTTSAITNGQPDGDDHPYVCLVVFDIWDGTNYVPVWSTTGILLSPTVVLTAGHGTDGTDRARIWIESEVTDPEYPLGGGTSIESFEVHTHPDFGYSGATGLVDWIVNDVGIVILLEPVYVSRYAELPEVGAVDELEMKEYVDQVGYGVQWQETGGGPPVWKGDLVRYYAPAQYIASNHAWSDEFMKTTANPGNGKGGTCYGDSGGPILEEYTDVVLALTSWGTNGNCAGVSYNQRIDIQGIIDFINPFLL